MQRVIFSIRPRWEGGYDIYLADSWVGSGLGIEQVQALARQKAEEETRKGQVALVAVRNMRGEVVSVQWFDPPRDVVSIPELNDVDAPAAGSEDAG
jgi:hypothetical protein